MTARNAVHVTGFGHPWMTATCAIVFSFSLAFVILALLNKHGLAYPDIRRAYYRALVVMLLSGVALACCIFS